MKSVRRYREDKSAALKNKFLFRSFAAFCACLMQGEAADCLMLLRMIRQVSSDRLEASLSSLYTSRRCSRNRSPSRLPVSPIYNFLQRVQVIMKGHVLHRARAHLKVPGCLLVLNALLTKKLPMFLSRLNEINGGCEKILLVSGSF